MQLDEISAQLKAADETRQQLTELIGQQVPAALETTVPTDHPLIGKRVIARTYTSGVSIGTLNAHTTNDAGFTVHLTDAVRLWNWEGAFTLSEVATAGPSGARIATHPEAGVWMSDRGLELLAMSDEGWARLMSVAVEGAE